MPEQPGHRNEPRLDAVVFGLSLDLLADPRLLFRRVAVLPRGKREAGERRPGLRRDAQLTALIQRSVRQGIDRVQVDLDLVNERRLSERAGE